MKKCRYCGMKCPDFAEYCGNCGEKFAFINTNTGEERTRKKKKILILFTVVFSLIILMIAFWILTGPHVSVISFAETLSCKNNISIPKEKNYIKHISMEAASEVMRKMKNGQMNNVPESILEVSEMYRNIEVDSYNRIDYYTGFNKNLLSDVLDEDLYPDGELFESSILTIVGRNFESDGLSFAGAFSVTADLNSVEDLENCAIFLKYTDSFSVGIVLVKEEKNSKVLAWPIAGDFTQKFYEELNMFFDEHLSYS